MGLTAHSYRPRGDGPLPELPAQYWDIYSMALKCGDWVEVRSKEEILATLDGNGRLEGLPFMPEMFQYCGKRLQVYKRAHKTCDPDRHGRLRRLKNVVHLEVRCDGEAHGGCEAGCLIFWKEGWLRPVAGKVPPASQVKTSAVRPVGGAGRCSEADVWKATRALKQAADNEPTYACQATQVPEFTEGLHWIDPRQYVEDFTSGNTSLSRLAWGLFFALTDRPGARRYPTLHRVYDLIAPRRNGRVPSGTPAPIVSLNLKPGELVRIKSYEEILATLNANNSNRGLHFDVEMIPFCGRTFRVRRMIHKFLDERTGRMRTLKTPAVILENAWCHSAYSHCKMHCPRSIYNWWREVWLERVEELKELPPNSKNPSIAIPSKEPQASRAEPASG